MFKKVVVGIDAETHGSDAIALARRLADPEAEIVFAHVHAAMTAAAMTAAVVNGPGSETDYPEETHDLLVAAIRESGIDAWMRWIGSPSVGAGLQAIAQQVGADLLVVGSTDRGRLTRTLLGNPTTETLAEADCAVAVAPHGYASHARPLKRVGVAYDESAASEAALLFAGRLAKGLEAELSALEVVPALRGALEPSRHRVEKAVQALTAARVRLAEHEGVDAHVACGRAVEQLAGYSNTIDLLVAGARGAGAIERLLHPSTTAALTDAVHCPLLVLTRGAREREPIAS